MGEGKRIKMLFTNFKVGRSSYGNPKADYVSITDKDGTKLAHHDVHSRLGIWASDKEKETVSNTNTVFVTFVASEFLNYDGWRLEWEMVGEEFVSPKRGVLTSPNFPHFYPQHVNSTETIQVTKGNVIKMQFRYFRCLDDGVCWEGDFVCDGYEQCVDGSDEGSDEGEGCNLYPESGCASVGGLEHYKCLKTS